MSAHTCHANGCETAVPRKMFMCRRHWYMLPKAMRDAVWAEYTPGQERNMELVTDDYLRVTREAINFVRAAESVPSGDQP